MITTDNTKTLENALAEIERLNNRIKGFEGDFYREKSHKLENENKSLRNSERRKLAGMFAQSFILFEHNTEKEIAEMAVKQADVLIAELDKGE